ncbi:hypothetical protein BHE74_00049634 [Ensete ventricosum]|nr:hypothetical protein BHE74_00049634 [Ensete ventricosum]
MEKESQPVDYAVHALAGYVNSQIMKVGGLLKQQPITVLIDTGSTNNFLNSKVVARLALQIEEGAVGLDIASRGATLSFVPHSSIILPGYVRGKSLS